MTYEERERSLPVRLWFAYMDAVWFVAGAIVRRLFFRGER